MRLRGKLAAIGCALAAGALAGCGTGAVSPSGSGSRTAARRGPSAVAAAAVVGSSAAGSRGTAKEVADPQEASSFPAPASVHHAAAATPAKAGEAIVAAGAPSDAEVRREL